MSLHINCEKCGKPLGGCEPIAKDFNERQRIFKAFFKATAKSICETPNNCPYGE